MPPVSSVPYDRFLSGSHVTSVPPVSSVPYDGFRLAVTALRGRWRFGHTASSPPAHPSRPQTHSRVGGGEEVALYAGTETGFSSPSAGGPHEAKKDRTGPPRAGRFLVGHVSWGLGNVLCGSLVGQVSRGARLSCGPSLVRSTTPRMSLSGVTCRPGLASGTISTFPLHTPSQVARGDCLLPLGTVSVRGTVLCKGGQSLVSGTVTTRSMHSPRAVQASPRPRGV